jgi:hypothetical protein
LLWQSPREHGHIDRTQRGIQVISLEQKQA